jgi:hypothetical protein
MPVFSPASHSTIFHQLSSYSSRYPLAELKCFVNAAVPAIAIVVQADLNPAIVVEADFLIVYFRQMLSDQR